MTCHFIERIPKIQLAYRYTQPQKDNNTSPGVVFLPGFKSDMQGSKASYLEGWCADQNLNFLRFDYSGHGESGGNFTEGTIGSWYADAKFIIENVTRGPQILVGSSMGGWISLLLGMRVPKCVAGLVLIAPAPDFTSEIEAQLTKMGHIEMLHDQGYVEIPSDYDEPYIFTKDLIEDGKDHLMLHQPITYEGPVRILQGKQDTSVPWEKALKIKSLCTSGDVEITFIEHGDHSLSRAQDLEILTQEILGLLA